MPLTTTGIAIQILSSLHTRRLYPDQCTVNDCKVVVNHLIRKFSEPLGRTGESSIRQSAMVKAGEVGNTVRDHAVPVTVLVEQLLQWPHPILEISQENIEHLEQYLRDSLLIVEVTSEEDRVLSGRGFQRRMPEGWTSEGHELYRNPLARYIVCDIDI